MHARQLFIALVASILLVLSSTASAASDPRNDMRLPWQPSSAPFIRHWLICGQFPAPSKEDNGINTDYLADHGGEASLVPTEGLTHKGPDGADYKWVVYDSPTDVVDIAAALKSQPRDNSITYAFATLTSEKETTTLLTLGSDDGVKLFVNGQPVYTHITARAARPDDDGVQITLKKGDNHLLFKIQNGGGGVGVCARLGSITSFASRPAVVNITSYAEPKVLPIEVDSPLYKQIPNLPPARVELLAPGGEVVASQTLARGDRGSLDIANLKDGPYELRCTSTSPDGRQGITYLNYFKGDMLPFAKRVVDAAASPGLGDITTRMLAEMILDRVGGKLEGLTAIPGSVGWSVHSALLEAAELELAASGKPAQIRPNGFVRLAYVDDVDNSPQFCRAYLPAHYDPAKSWPMVVSLHGYNPPNPRYINWWSVEQRHHPLADNYDVIVLEPHGRGNTGYEGMGRLDVLKCIELAKSRFSVDPDRILLLGYSMGGGGTWHVGTRHPDLFAAIAPVFGGGDYRARMSADDLAKLTDFHRYRAERDSSLAQAESLLTTPIFINHGDADELVHPDLSRYNVRFLQRWGYNVRYWEHPGLGHTDMGSEDELMRWFLALRRTTPTHVRLRAMELKCARAHWLAITQRANLMEPMCAEARITGPNTISINTANALELTLSSLSSPPMIDPSKPLTIIWNDGAARTLTPDANGTIVLRADGYTPGNLVKTPHREGPINDFSTTPFAIVIGTSSPDPLMRQACQLHARRAADDWEKWQHVKPRTFLDTELEDKDLPRYSLVLIGGPDANAVTRKLADRIPLKIQGSTVTIDGKSFDAPDSAVGMIYPHPLNPQRYVVVLAATSPSGQFHHAASPDDVDFYISDGHMSDWRVGRPEERTLVACGLFDRNWRLDDKLLFVADPAIRAKASVRKVPRYLSAPTDVDRLMLSDLLPSDAQGSFSDLKRDLNWRNQPMVLAGKTYTNGIAVAIWRDVTSTADFDLSATTFKHLRATIGIETDDPAKIEPKQKERTRVLFIVTGDGKELYRSPAFAWDSPPQDIDVDITGVKLLRLEVAGEGLFNAATSVDWADARVEK